MSQEPLTIEAESYRPVSRLPIRHISACVEDTLDIIEKRQRGEEKSLDTGFVSLNNALLGGLEWNRIFTIAGLSGGGKSITAELLKNNLIQKNDVKFDVLSFNFEMPAVDDLSRLVSNKVNLNREELYSAYTPLSADNISKVKEALDTIAQQRVYISEVPGTAKEIYETIMDFILTRRLVENNIGLVVTLDHTLLITGRTDNEKSIIDEFYKMLVQLKKEIISMGGRAIFIILSQLNRDIENEKRVMNPKLHYPQKSDLFAASSAYYCSDYVLVIHKPSLINGMPDTYGPKIGTQYPKGLPVWNPNNPSEAMVYFHLIKNRFGQSNTIMMMIDQYQYSRIVPYVG